MRTYAVSRSFNGSSQYLEATTPVTAVPLTIACWVRPGTLTGSHEVVAAMTSPGGTAANAFRLNVSSSAGARAVQVGNSSTGFSAFGTALPSGWSHVAAVFAANNSRTAYQNGVAGTANTTNLIPSAVPTTLRTARYDSTALNYFPGLVAHPAIWNVALNAGEVLALAQGAPPWLVRPEGLVFLPFLTGAAVEFESRGGFHLTTFNAPGVGEDPLRHPDRPLELSISNSLFGSGDAAPAANPNANERYLASRYGITL